MPGWTTLRSDTAPDGAYVEMRYAESGTGPRTVGYWRIFRDGRYAGYASVAADADVNYERVIAGFERNASTGRYEPIPRTIVDTCPICGCDLKRDGYPTVHQADPDGEHCAFVLDLDETNEDH